MTSTDDQPDRAVLLARRAYQRVEREQVLDVVFGDRSPHDGYGEMNRLQVTSRDAGGFLAQVDIPVTGATRLGMQPWAERSGAR